MPATRRPLISFLRKPRTGLNKVQELLSLCRALLSERGEVSGARLAKEVIDAYQSLDPASVELFLDRLATSFLPEMTPVRQAAELYQRDPSPEHLLQLQDAVESPRQELFRRWNIASGGTDSLIGMRKTLLAT